MQYMRKFTVPAVLILGASLFFGAYAASAADFFDSTYRATALATVQLRESPTRASLRLQGTVLIRQSAVDDFDADGLPDIQTEILQLNLSGTTTQGLAINLNSSKSNRSMGMAEQFAPPSRRVNSFFDIFTELSMGNPPPGTTALEGGACGGPVRLQGMGRSLENLSGMYTQRKSISIIMCDREGKPLGTLTLFATNLNSSRSN